MRAVFCASVQTTSILSRVENLTQTLLHRVAWQLLMVLHELTRDRQTVVSLVPGATGSRRGMHLLDALVHHAFHAEVFEVVAVASRRWPKLVAQACRRALGVDCLLRWVSLVVRIVLLEEVFAHHGRELVVGAHRGHLGLLLLESLEIASGGHARGAVIDRVEGARGRIRRPQLIGHTVIDLAELRLARVMRGRGRFGLNLIDRDGLVVGVGAVALLGGLGVDHEVVPLLEVAHEAGILLVVDYAVRAGCRFYLRKQILSELGHFLHGLLGLEDIEKGAMGRLDGQEEVLVFRTFGHARPLPEIELFQIVMSYVCVLCVARILLEGQLLLL